MDAIPWQGLGIGSGWAIVAAGVFAILRGHLIPRTVHDEIVRERDTQVRKSEEERIHWRDVALRALGVTERMTKPVEVAAEVLTRLPDPAEEARQ